MLYGVSKGRKLGEAVLTVVDAINRGLGSILHTLEMRIDVAKLNLVIHGLCADVFSLIAMSKTPVSTT